ncbi:MAG: hypothetical protein KIH08_03725 [Candidatus Freyarchaeota archaeon]|nr:hypothetical protein [Candidatus Jordarchaeia archaeon]MBS7268280.1 hypothetical protein [Candidatus Jordarchaeia archaeon]MBS7279208.1 hypothetical protein [Candidatus Jordarchaeia archaeon]
MRQKTREAIIICSLLLLPLAGLIMGGALNSSGNSQFLLCFSTSELACGSSLSVKDTHMISFNSDTAHDLTIYRPPAWSISSINITLSNITTPTYNMVVEDYAEMGIPLFVPGSSINDSIYLVCLMSFNVTDVQRVYFNKLGALLINTEFNTSAYVDVAILNATYNYDFGILLPNETLKVMHNISLANSGGPLEFKTLNLTSNPDEYLYLDTAINQTDYNTYFIAIAQNVTAITDPIIYWFYATDSHNGDQGDAWWAAFWYGEETPFAFSNRDFTYNDTFDFCLKLYLNPSDPSQGNPWPSDLGLRINGVNVNSTGPGSGWWSTTENLSLNPLFFDFSSNWSTWSGGTCPVSFTAEVWFTYQEAPNILLASLTQVFLTMTYFEDQREFKNYLFLVALGSIVVAGAAGYKLDKRRKIPRNALQSLEHIIVDHNNTGVLLWAFDFVSMEQDIALISGFMSAIKSFLEEMKVGGLKRLGTEFGTFIREESELLTATCITSDIGIDEELWIRGKLHKFLTQIEQQHRRQLEEWKGDVGQFKETFPMVLGSVIDLDRVHKLHKQKFSRLSKKKQKLQREVNKYGAKLEELKSKYDSGELDYEEYTAKRLKTEYKYDKVQKDYIYASLFLSKVPLETVTSQKQLENLQEIQKRFVEIRMQIEELRRKQSEGTFNENDRKRKEKLQKELIKLVEKLDRYQKG